MLEGSGPASSQFASLGKSLELLEISRPVDVIVVLEKDWSLVEAVLIVNTSPLALCCV